ncbi:FAD-dependent oxidoreductase [Streptomyces iranensis]|uniref:FAD-dependent oxidoreductase n=1 Tax=Streptomyces iranensis TaxID=576784 RepID=UPI00099DAA19
MRLPSAQEAEGLRKALDGADDVVIVGGGLIGPEVAAAVRARGIRATVIESCPGHGTRSFRSDAAPLHPGAPSPRSRCAAACPGGTQPPGHRGGSLR